MHIKNARKVLILLPYIFENIQKNVSVWFHVYIMVYIWFWLYYIFIFNQLSRSGE